jgi:hypothetical protein
MSIPTYGLQDIKKEIQHLRYEQLSELCLRLVRYKKENKELLAYLLFEANDEHAFVEKVKAEVGFMLSQLPSHSYLASKSVRKVLRLISKYVKFMASKPAEIDLLLNFCFNYLQYINKNTSYKPLRMILMRQVEKINTNIKKLHEDLQFDHSQEYNRLLDEAENKFSWFYKNDYLL